MFKAISGALSLLLVILVLKIALPDIADQVIAIVLKLLTIINQQLDHIATTSI
ncbi:MAG: hypothetical protein WCK11_01275 [Candidatus Falkowbacteria bacterium]